MALDESEIDCFLLMGAWLICVELLVLIPGMEVQGWPGNYPSSGERAMIWAHSRQLAFDSGAHLAQTVVDCQVGAIFEENQRDVHLVWLRRGAFWVLSYDCDRFGPWPWPWSCDHFCPWPCSDRCGNRFDRHDDHHRHVLADVGLAPCPWQCGKEKPV